MSKAAGSKSNHEQSVSMIHFESVSSRVQLVHSTIPELWGLYAVCNFHLIFRALHTCWIKSATNAGPLSDPILVGNPNLGISSQIKQWATWFAFSVRWGRPLPNCRRYILWLVSNANAGTFISVKSTSKCSKGRVPINCIPGDLCWCLGAALTCEQAEQFWDSILHREESHGIKKFSKSIFLFCHAPNGLSGEFETLARGPESWEPATCHPAVPPTFLIFGGPLCFSQLILGRSILWESWS